MDGCAAMSRRVRPAAVPDGHAHLADNPGKSRHESYNRRLHPTATPTTQKHVQERRKPF